MPAEVTVYMVDCMAMASKCFGKPAFSAFHGLGFRGLGVEGVGSAIGALIITYTILGVPHYTYSIMGPKTLFYGHYITGFLLLGGLFLSSSGWS